MPLNEDGVPCVRVGERTGRVIYRYDGQGNPKPSTRELEHKLIPAVQRGWRETLVYEIPEVRNDGRIDLVQFTLRNVTYSCANCGTSEYVLLKLMGWDYHAQRNVPHKGNGPVWKCFKCGVTVGPIDPHPTEGRKGKRDVIKTGISKKEALDVVYKYGLDFDLSLLT